mmetsp:Transcript_27704/g.65797  ORF Transcript_27704/g.65797 Transcript_27704/m.65797 type:complete len:230 (+) Transcript_27704:345-1034(+)
MAAPRVPICLGGEGRCGHCVQGRAMLEPVNLVLVEAVVDLEGVLLAVGPRRLDGQRDARGEGVQALDGELVGWLDQVVILGVGKRERQHALLLQVCLVDAGKRPDDHSCAAQVTGLEGSVLARGALPVVLVPNHDPPLVVCLVVAGDIRNGAILPGQLVLDLVHLVVLRVHRADQHIVGDVVEVSAVLEPGARHGDVVGGALALGLDQHERIVDGVSELLEGLQELEAV